MSSALRLSRVHLLPRDSQAPVPWNRLLQSRLVPRLHGAAFTTSIPNQQQQAHGRSLPGARHPLRTPSALPALSTAATTAVFQPWNTLAILCSCAAAAQAAEEHTGWGKLLSAPLLTLLLALGAASLGLLPATSPVYDVVWSHLMPLAVALFLLDHDVSNIKAVGGPVLVSFLLGAVMMVLGACLSWLLCKSALAAAAGSTAAAAQLAACLLASYIGGSINFIAVAAATQLPTHLVPGAMAADNLGMLLLLGLLMAAPLRWLQQQQQRKPRSGSSSSGGKSAGPAPAAAALPAVGSASRLGVKPSASPGSTAAAPAPAPAPAAPAPAPAAPAVPSGPLGLDGSPLLTEPPSSQELAACFEATTRGRKQTAPLAAPNSSSLSSNGNGSTTSSSNGKSVVAPTAADVASGASSSTTTTSAAATAAAVGKCGGCRGSGVTAHDDHPLLTRAPGMGDAISTIAAARQGKPQLLTPPKPPSSRSYTTRPDRTAAAAAVGSNGTAAKAAAAVSNGSSSSSSNDGYSSEEVPDGLITGCGCCQEALDAIAAASPAPAALLSSTPGSSSSNSSTSSSSSNVTPGALALDGSPLLTEEPDTDRLAAAVAAARSGGSSGSSVAVTPLSSGEFELLVKLDKDTLLQRLREQQQKQQQQQEKQSALAAVAATPQQQQQQQRSRRPGRIVSVDTSGSSSSSSGSDSSMDERDTRAVQKAPAAAAAAAAVSQTSFSVGGSTRQLTVSSAAAAVAAATCACAAAHQLAVAFNAPALHQLLLGVIAVTISAAATALSKRMSGTRITTAAAAVSSARSPFAGASQLGQVLVGVFFAALGASCCCPLSTLACCLPLLAFVTLMTTTHWALLYAVGSRLLQLPGEVLLCGSAAAIGGPATAAGLASARGWGALVQPSLLCGSLGYALGTGAGLVLAQVLGVLP